MEPKQSSPNIGPEAAPVNYGQNFEQSPTIPTPEAPVERRQEVLEQRSDAAIASASPAAPVAPVLPSPVVAAPQDDTKSLTTDDTPSVANDDDLIEKEWVDKAKKIITQTKDDPYRREQEVEKLQADYLRKRYGRELGASQ
jgi:Txe/YoeB family toxin of Txe-Axe toxin-antitoxin module